MLQWLLKFSGGRQGDSIADITAEQLSAFEEFDASMMENIQELPIEIQDKLAEQDEATHEQFTNALEEFKKQLLQNIEDDKKWNGIREFRKATKVSPLQLNNIEPPNVLLKIWDTFVQLNPQVEATLDIDDFFQLKTNPIYPDKPYYNYQKVTLIYNKLNTLGYYPDSKIHQERRLIASISDTGHASMATFCNTLFSNDKNFIKKTRAAYEYLGITTQVIHVTINKEQKRD